MNDRDAPLPDHFASLAEEWRPPARLDEDVISVAGPAAFAALVDGSSPVQRDGDPLPPLWHWLAFQPLFKASELGEDGHPREVAFYPPLQRRRRMFGGGSIEVVAPLRVGDHVQRRTSVSSVRARLGSSGPLLLVTLELEYRVADQLRLREVQDLVYREANDEPGSETSRPRAPSEPDAGAGVAEPAAPWRRSFEPGPVSLFAFSAVTRNMHRIHYDRPYATQIEGYPGLVVHGPLLAMLLLELPRHHAPDRVVRRFRWRARRPLFDHDVVECFGYPTDDLAEVELAAGTGRQDKRVVATAELDVVT